MVQEYCSSAALFSYRKTLENVLRFRGQSGRSVRNRTDDEYTVRGAVVAWLGFVLVLSRARQEHLSLRPLIVEEAKAFVVFQSLFYSVWDHWPINPDQLLDGGW